MDGDTSLDRFRFGGRVGRFWTWAWRALGVFGTSFFLSLLIAYGHLINRIPTLITSPKRKTHSPRDPSSHHSNNPSRDRNPPTRSWGRCVCSSRTSGDRRLSKAKDRGQNLPIRSLGWQKHVVVLALSVGRRSVNRWRARAGLLRAGSRRRMG